MFSPLSQTRRRPPAARRAFTLIELLVVVAIISILASILFPVFARARDNARRTTSLSNIKQLGMGFQLYMQDYDEKFPNVATFPPANRWPYKLMPYLTTTSLLVSPAQRNSYTETIPLYYNPGHPTDAISYELSVFPDYGFNFNYLGRTPSMTGPMGTTNVALAAVMSPSETVMLTSSAFASTPPGGFYHISPPSISSDAMSSYVSPRYLGRTAVVAFVDGHVKAMRYESLRVRNPNIAESSSDPRYPYRFDTLWDLE